MPKVTQYPKLRSHTRSRKRAGSLTYYFFDMRGTGKPDVNLGTDWALALKRWAEISASMPPRQKAVKPPHPNAAYMALPAWAKKLYQAAKHRATDTGRRFTLTRNEFAAVVRRDQCCAVSGMPFQQGKRHPFSPSLDRRDSRGGYTLENVRIVVLAANVAMNSWGDGALAELASAVVKLRSAETDGS
jgi:hypothetical protein